MARERTLSEQAFEQFPQALILVDRETTVLSLNAVGERLTGWAMRDAVGRPAADILEVRTETGVNLCAPNGALRRALRLGTRINTHFAYLFRLRTSDDPVRVSYSVSPIRLKGKTPDAAVIIIHDVTPELETIEARDALMLAASHELKTPLTTLKGLSELLLDFDLSEAQRRELLQDLHGQAVGIRKEHMPRLFEKFYRADDPIVRRTSGTGLGLYIVRSLVTMLGGQVHVRSRHGKGTVFTVILPRAEATTRTRPRVAVGAQ